VTFFLNAEEGYGNNRSVMPLDVQGCTRTTLINSVGVVFSPITYLVDLVSGAWPRSCTLITVTLNTGR